MSTPLESSAVSASLWRHRDFRRYLTGQTASVAGSSISSMALRVLAVHQRYATTGQVALLAFVGQLPPALLALHAGALADRYTKRRQMITGDLAGAAVPATVPVAAALHTLSLEHLMAVAAVQGSAGVLHDAAAISLLPGLVDRSLMQRSNSRVGALFAIAATGGSNLGAALTALLGPARAVVNRVASADPAHPDPPAAGLPRRWLGARGRWCTDRAAGVCRSGGHNPALHPADHHRIPDAGPYAGRQHVADLWGPSHGRAAGRRARYVGRSAARPGGRHLPARRTARGPGPVAAAHPAADARSSDPARPFRRCLGGTARRFRFGRAGPRHCGRQEHQPGELDGRRDAVTQLNSSTEAAPITSTAPEPRNTPIPALATCCAGTATGADAATARAAMVDRLEESGDLSDGPVRDALLALPREVLMPQAYVRRTALTCRRAGTCWTGTGLKTGTNCCVCSTAGTACRSSTGASRSSAVPPGHGAAAP